MEKKLLNKMITWLRLCIAGLIMVIISLFLFSFTMEKLTGDFLKQLGINQQEANSKITGSLLSGSLDHYGIRNLKNIVFSDRAGVVKDIAGYAKQYANSAAFKKEYAALRESNKPAPAKKVETPEEMRASMIKMANEFVQTAEETLKKTGPDMKKIFEQNLEAAKKNLKDVRDPANRTIKMYEKNYEALKTLMQQSYENSIKDWEARYPANHLLFIKVKLQAFLDATSDIDFNAQLKEKGGIKYFVNPDHERKENRWKMAFRAGKEAVEAGRAFAEQWIAEIQ
jgi:hypothetical protein